MESALLHYYRSKAFHKHSRYHLSDPGFVNVSLSQTLTSGAESQALHSCAAITAKANSIHHQNWGLLVFGGSHLTHKIYPEPASPAATGAGQRGPSCGGQQPRARSELARRRSGRRRSTSKPSSGPKRDVSAAKRASRLAEAAAA